MTVHAFTSFSFSYLNRARVLADGLGRAHPDWVLWAVVTDVPPGGVRFDLAADGFTHTLFAEELMGDGAEAWLFGHDVVEACTAVKGAACRHILDVPGCQKLVYFDPDIAVFNPLDDVIDLLDEADIVLTPHQIVPEPRAARYACQSSFAGAPPSKRCGRS